MEGISIGIGITTLITLIGAAWRLSHRLTQVETEVANLREKILRLNGIGDRFQGLEATCKERHRVPASSAQA